MNFNKRCLLLLPLASYVLFVFTIQWLRYQNGLQGLDFAIFSQVLHNTSKLGVPLSSLIDIHFQNFLTHHLSLYFFPLALTNLLRGDAGLTLILYHSVNVGLILLLLGLLAFHFCRNVTNSALFTAIVALHPYFLFPSLWEMHDENLGISFILLGIYLFLKDKHILVITSLLLAALFKETMLFFCGFLAVVAVLKTKEQKFKIYYGIFAVISICCFILYFKILPFRMFIPTFDGTQRIARLDQLFDQKLLRMKFTWLSRLILPFFPLIALSLGKEKILRIFAPLFLIALPFMGPILISNFEPMFSPYVYYGMNPTIMFAVSIIFFIPFNKALLSCCLLCAVLINPKADYIQEILTGVDKTGDELIESLPLDSTIIAGDFDVIYFIRHKRVVRIEHANRSHMKFDYIVQRKIHPIGRKEKLSLFLRSWSKPCLENEKWEVRCALNKFSAKQAAQ